MPIPDFDEVINGLVTRIGDAREHNRRPRRTATRVSVNADWSGVYAVTDKFRIEDFYRYDNWRIPGMWATYETNLFGGAGSGQLGLAQPLSVFNQVSPSTAGLLSPPYVPWRHITR